MDVVEGTSTLTGSQLKKVRESVFGAVISSGGSELDESIGRVEVVCSRYYNFWELRLVIKRT